jgi:hypothetical protein
MYVIYIVDGFIFVKRGVWLFRIVISPLVVISVTDFTLSDENDSPANDNIFNFIKFNLLSIPLSQPFPPREKGAFYSLSLGGRAREGAIFLPLLLSHKQQLPHSYLLYT